MENQVGSINFDANQLYLEEDSEHEDDKQQDNELKELISQGGLDGILDDDSLLSSSAESSYEDDEDGNQNQEHFHQHQKHSNQHHTHPHHHQRLQQQQQQQQQLQLQQQQQKLNDDEHDNLHNHINNNNNNNNNNSGNNQDQIEFNLANELNDMSIYGPVVAHNSTVANATPAHQIKTINPNINQNYILNQFSTPANTNVPTPHMLQATLIPSKQEDKMFYTRQRASNEMKSDPESQPQQSQPQPQPQPGNELMNQMYPMQQQQQQQYQPGGVGVEVDNDTLLMEQKTYINPNQYALIQQQQQQQQQQNLMPHHSKLHSMDRFSMRSNQLPPQLIQQQQPQQQHNHHEQLLENDHELSIENGSDDQDDQDERARPVVRNRLMPDESNLKTPTNKLIQIDFNHEANKNDQLMDDYGLVDLKELDENQLKQLKAEEEKQQQEEYFNIEHLNRLYCQAQFLYKIRGKKLEEVTNRFTAYQEDMAREMRAMKHRLYLAEKEKDGVQISLDQAHELCNKYKMETDAAVKSLGEQQDKYESLKQTNRQLEKKLTEYEQEIESLQMHINEQQKLDTLERVKEQNENFIQKLREQYERDMFQLKEQLAVQENEINEKNDFIKLMKLELDEMGKNLQEATVERASTVNRLTKSLNELQSKYNQDILIFEHNKNILNGENDSKTKMIEQLTQRLNDLEQELRMTTTKLVNTTTQQVDSSAPPPAPQPVQDQTTTISLNTTATSSFKTLQNELERTLAQLKQKRAELQSSQAEVERLGKLADELEHEKAELLNELNEKNAKLDQMLDVEEKYQTMKSNLEMELFNKQQHLDECEKLIEQLHAKNQDLSNNYLMKQQFQMVESQVAELKLILTNKENELLKVREMYIEVCNDKNNLQDTLKQQYDVELEAKLKDRVQATLSNRLEEQKTALTLEFGKQLEANSTEINSLKESLNQIRLEKVNFELNSTRVESQYKDKIINLERLLKEKEIELNESKFRSETELGEKIALLRKERDDLSERLVSVDAKWKDVVKMGDEERQKLNEQIERLKRETADIDAELNEQRALNEQLAVELKQHQCELELRQAEKAESNDQLNELLSQERAELTKQLELNEQIRRELNELTVKFDQAKQSWSKEKTSLSDEVNQSGRARVKLQQLELELDKHKELNDQLKKEMSDLTAKFDQAKQAWAKEKTSLSEEVNQSGRVRVKLQQLELELDKHKELNEQLKKEMSDLSTKYDQEKGSIVARKDEEIQRVIHQLEKRFEDDYAKFMQTHKEAMHRALNDKTVEHAKEKEKLMDIYQNKFNEYEANEQSLLKQLKELREKVKSNTAQENSQRTQEAKQCQTDASEPDRRQDEEHQHYVQSLLEKIKSLEECINKTDEHFELELEKLRQQFEDEYRTKLDAEVDDLRRRMSSEHEELSITAMSTNSSGSLNYTKYAKIKEELNMKEKELETIEQAYRNKLDQLQDKFDMHLKQMKSKYELDLQRARQELNENYKQSLNKSKGEIEQMQLFVQKLKKANMDSDKVIESLKQEMKKVKETHLDELTMLKINSEREKEALKENNDQLSKKLSLVERQLNDNEDRFKKQMELQRAELKAEHGNELNKMTNKMNEMMRMHTNAVETLRKHHKNAYYKSPPAADPTGKNSSAQTEVTFKDIDLLETFREKYLETLTKMKTDMMKEFDAQTVRLTDRASRQISEERTMMKEKIVAIFMPKISDLLKEFRVSETMIRIKLSELEGDLIQITSECKRAGSYSNLSSRNSSLTRLNENEKLNRIEENIVSSRMVNTNPADTNANVESNGNSSTSAAKRSVSALGTVIRPNLAKSDDFNLSSSLYSKSVSSMKDMQPSPVQPPSPARLSNDKERTPVTLSSAYKYTPLRQSWSNLTQANQQLSPYSGSRVINEENINEEDSPSSAAYQPKNTKYITSTRPNTANVLMKTNILNDVTNNENIEKEKEDVSKEDYVYVDDTGDFDSKNSYFQKYRTQNIRQKKAQRIQLVSQKQNGQQTQQPTQHQPRPHSASNLIRSTSNFVTAKLINTGGESASETNLSRNFTVSRSNTNVTEKRSLTAGGRSTLSTFKDIEFESDTEIPIRLCSDESDESLSKATTGNNTNSSNIRTVSSISSRSSSTLGVPRTNATNGGGPPNLINSNSLPRSRTPTGPTTSLSEYTTTSMMNSNPSYRNSTISSTGKSIHLSNENLNSKANTTLNNQNSIVSNASTQYHSINSNVASNLAKNAAAFQKKKSTYNF